MMKVRKIKSEQVRVEMYLQVLNIQRVRKRATKLKTLSRLRLKREVGVKSRGKLLEI